MIFLLGASGYVGSAFRRELARAWLPHRAISRVDLDYTHFRPLVEVLRKHRPDLVILCGAFTGRPSVDVCEERRSETITGNIVLAQTVAQACDAADVRLGVISSGAVFSGAWVQGENRAWLVRENLNAPDLTGPLSTRSARIRGFDDADPPNFTFETGGNFFSGVAAARERMVLDFPSAYLWRLHMPVEERDHPRNYLSQLQTSPRLWQTWNSITYLRDAVTACLQIWNADLPGGAFNIVNPGYISTREIVELIRVHRHPGWAPPFWASDDEFYENAAKARRASCLLEARRLAEAGIKMRPLESALVESIRNWTA